MEIPALIYMKLLQIFYNIQTLFLLIVMFYKYVHYDGKGK